MVIACSDSRVDAQTVFGAVPGELFVVRNVAALVPPFEPDAGYHGTSAALEFGVKVLKVVRLVVLGHGQCGGVRAMAVWRESTSNCGRLQVALTLGNHPAVDFMVISASGQSFSVDVKGLSSRNGWIVRRQEPRAQPEPSAKRRIQDLGEALPP